MLLFLIQVTYHYVFSFSFKSIYLFLQFILVNYLFSFVIDFNQIFFDLFQIITFK